MRIFVRSVGAVGVDYIPHEETDAQYRRAMALIGDELKKSTKISVDDLPPYSPIFITNNAITLKMEFRLYLDFTENPKRYIRTTILSIVLHIGRAGITR